MIQVSESAIEAVAEYFTTLNIKPIRIVVTQGRDGQRLAMPLDESSGSDTVYQESEFQFIVDCSLLGEAQPVHVDYAKMG